MQAVRQEGRNQATTRSEPEKESPGELNTRRGFPNLEHETGLEPATPTLARGEEAEEDPKLTL